VIPTANVTQRVQTPVAAQSGVLANATFGILVKTAAARVVAMGFAIPQILESADVMQLGVVQNAKSGQILQSSLLVQTATTMAYASVIIPQIAFNANAWMVSTAATVNERAAHATKMGLRLVTMVGASVEKGSGAVTVRSRVTAPRLEQISATNQLARVAANLALQEVRVPVASKTTILLVFAQCSVIQISPAMVVACVTLRGTALVLETIPAR
jgi:hypothetical protein